MRYILAWLSARLSEMQIAQLLVTYFNDASLGWQWMDLCRERKNERNVTGGCSIFSKRMFPIKKKRFLYFADV